MQTVAGVLCSLVMLLFGWLAVDWEFADFSKRQKHYNVQPDGEMMIPLAEEGIAASQPITIPEVFEVHAIVVCRRENVHPCYRLCWC